MNLQKSLIATLLLFPGLALAHSGVGDSGGFLHGMSHPVTGVDHLIAMVAVGLWAAQLGGRALWIVPGAFVSVMLLGGILGFSGMTPPFIETSILVSILVLGVLIAGAFRFPVAVGTALAGFFALVHGFAHGAEMPAAAGAVSYSLGFALATASLHGVGLAVGLTLRRLNLADLGRCAGGAIALGGIYLAVA